MSREMVENNIKAMVEFARMHKIRVVLGTVLPASAMPGARASTRCRQSQLNIWIRGYAHDQRIALVDYFATLDNGTGGLSAADSRDGVHPTRSGYAKMETIARRFLPPIDGPG